MDYHGSALRLAPGDYKTAADSIQVEEAALRAVTEVECRSSGFGPSGRPIILFERHRFYAELGPSEERNLAVKQGLAYPNWGQRPYPKTQELVWAEFERAAAIDEEAAIKATSWGLGQIMGSNYELCGYDSPQDMVVDFCESEAAQLNAMCRYIKNRGLDNAMRQKNWATFALKYNGPGYKKNKYDTKLSTAYQKWSRRAAAQLPMESTDGVIRYGDKGPRVAALQTALDRKGYHLQIDGDKPGGGFGTRTRDMVLAWKADNDLPLTVEMTPQDLVKLENSPDRPVPVERSTATVSDLKGKSGIIDTASTLKKAAASALTVTGLSEVTTPPTPEGVTPDASPALLDRAQDLADKAGKAKGVFDSVKETGAGIAHSIGLESAMTFIAANKFLILFIVLLGVFLGVTVIQKMRVAMHQKGEAV